MRNLSILFLSFLLFTCNSSDDNTKASFKVDLLLTDVVNQNILPAVDYFVSESVNLNTAVETYLAASTEFNLEALRVQWQVSAKAMGIFMLLILEMFVVSLCIRLYSIGQHYQRR